MQKKNERCGKSQILFCAIAIVKRSTISRASYLYYYSALPMNGHSNSHAVIGFTINSKPTRNTNAIVAMTLSTPSTETSLFIGNYVFVQPVYRIDINFVFFFRIS